MGHLLGYARVSTTDQHPSSRSTPSSTPAAIGCSPKPPAAPRTDRPTLAQVLDQLRLGDTVVVWNLDRLGRSLRHLVDTVTGLAERAIGFCSLREAIDTTTPGGKLVFHVVAALAEFERDLIRERTSAGLAAARALGTDWPQAPGGPGDLYVRAVNHGGDHHDLGVSPASIYRHLVSRGH
jgi:DNA invertase Pin-like site-specific DNA recombinase